VVTSSGNLQIVVIKHEPLDVFHLVESLAQDVFYSVVTKVDDFQLYVFVPDAKHVPVQCRQMVPVEQQHLGVVGQLFQHFGVFEAGVSAVDHKNFFPSFPVVVGEVPASTLGLKNFGTPSVIDGVPISGADHVYQKKQAQCRSIEPSHDVIINLSHATVMLFPVFPGVLSVGSPDRLEWSSNDVNHISSALISQAVASHFKEVIFN